MQATASEVTPLIAEALLDAGTLLDAATLCKALGESVPPEVSVVDFLRDCRAAELALTVAARQGHKAALEQLTADYQPKVVATLRKLGATDADVADVQQTVWRRLLAPDPNASRYSGAGELMGYLRIAAIREYRRRARRGARVEARPTVDLQDMVVDAEAHPDMAALQAQYKDEFGAAFGDATRSLSSKERNLLRYQYVDGLGVDAIGAIYGVHRSTAARWIARARDVLLERTRREFAARTAVSETECDSLFALMRSQLDVSLGALLATQVGE